ncbi:YicC family protein [Paenirhodobacter sp.]|uniref:YicC family protein n=1 Tax=Paenirhodobacter sp. TaxID=1965326 RepID=UPI003B5111D8
MTGFAARQGAGAGHSWTWDMRAVNGRGLDLRLRLPEIEGLEAPVRAAVAKAVSRGNITLSLRLTGAERGEGLRLSSPGLGAALVALREVEAAAQAAGLTLAPTRASDILALRSVTEQVLTESADMADLRALLLRDLDLLLREFAAMRQAEGAQIGAVVAAQAALMAALGRVMGGAAGADPQRVAQELALLAVKADVTEEIDRLRAHAVAARALLAAEGPVGRKLDFLTQEFVREANTLCSKSGSARLTAIGLDLKHVIDQMREQVQNLE